MAEHALTANAGNPRAVKHAGRVEERERQQLAAVTLETMGTYAGRMFCRLMLERLGVFRSIWSPNAEIHYRAGRQDAGHELMALLLETSEELYLTMEQEALTRAKKQRTETEAMNTQSLEEQKNGKNGNAGR